MEELREYLKPEMEIKNFENEDVITTSVEEEEGKDPDDYEFE